MGGIGSIIMAVFGVFWTIMAASVGAPIFFSAFGVLFIIMALAQAAYNWKNALSDERFSEYDIVDSEEEDFVKGRGKKDPCGGQKEEEGRTLGAGPAEESGLPEENGPVLRYCPYCGVLVEQDFKFCGSCGKELPEKSGARRNNQDT